MSSILSSCISFFSQNTGLTTKLLDYLHGAFGEVLEDWRCRLLEFGEVHLFAEIHPALNISTLVNNLKTASARRVRNRFSEHLKAFYLKPYFWHRAYFVGSVGERLWKPSVVISKAREPEKNRARRNRPFDPPFALRPEKGANVQKFNFGAYVGEIAGQRVMLAHVHLILRGSGDAILPAARQDEASL